MSSQMLGWEQVLYAIQERPAVDFISSGTGLSPSLGVSTLNLVLTV